MFHPWPEERELSPDDFESCLGLYESKRTSIEKVKNMLFPHQNNIEHGRGLIESLGDVRASHIVLVKLKKNARIMITYNVDFPMALLMVVLVLYEGLYTLVLKIQYKLY